MAYELFNCVRQKDKASIVGDTIDYVLELEKRLKQLQACKDSTAAGAFFKSLKRKTPYGRCDDSTNNDFSAMDAFSKPGGSAPSSDESIQQAGGARRLLSSPTLEAHSAVSSPSDQVTEESKLVCPACNLICWKLVTLRVAGVHFKSKMHCKNMICMSKLELIKNDVKGGFKTTPYV